MTGPGPVPFGLYYPEVAPSPAWLRASLLYWPAVVRMVPPDYPAPDDPDLRELTDAGTQRLWPL